MRQIRVYRKPFELLFFEFILGPNYIPPNQSYWYSSKRFEKEVRQQHENIMNIVKAQLLGFHNMSNLSTMIEQFCQQLLACLHARNIVPVSYLESHRARKEFKLIKSIQYRLKKHNYILRVADQSSIFHLSHATDDEQKAEAYQRKTAAYIALENDPLWTVFDKVVLLLNDLHAKNYLQAWQLEQMMPDRENIALAYLYFIPNTDRVT